MAHDIQRADVCIICALEEEVDAVEQVISERCQVAFLASGTSDGRFLYRSTTILNKKQEKLSLVLLCQTRPGPVSAALDLRAQLQLFQPCFVGMSGICAGDKAHMRLGDLAVAEHAYHFEAGKVTRDEQGRVLHHPEGITYGPAEHVLHYVRAFGAWRTPVAQLKQRLCKSHEAPRCVMTLMASGMAVRSDDPFEILQQQHRKTWALDMEAASFYLALRAFPDIDSLVVKGVVDYADLSKDDTFHDFAACASAIYLLTFIQEYVTTNALLRRRSLPVFMVPYPRNAFFTGRDELLTEIHTRFQTERATAVSQPQAMSGLGGIGKTQIAVEYAYRYRHEYQSVLWTLSDTRESLVSGYVAIAEVLNLPERQEQDQTRIVQAVMRWLAAQSEWLLILDNADDLAVVYEFLPSGSGGHLLLTTRAQATGPRVSSIEVDTMSEEVGALFLLRRAKLLLPDAQLTEAKALDRVVAMQISEELGGLPLALDQAGAYIEETRCGLRSYQSLYHAQRGEMLRERGSFASDYPKSVATTWSLSFKRVEEQNAPAADLLRFSAFLAPDAIPEELLEQGSAFLGPVLEAGVTDPRLLNQMVKVLLGYSLIRRDLEKKTLSVHRLVQAVLKESMDEQTQSIWMHRAIQTLNAAFPEAEFKEWTKCGRLVSHVQVCATWIGHKPILTPEASHLFLEAGVYLQKRGQYRDAEPLLMQALTLREQQLGVEHPDTAKSLNNLANLYTQQGKYEQAEPLYQRALAIREQHLGTEHLHTASSLNNLAMLYWHQGKYEQAEPLYQRTLAICEQHWGAEHPHTAYPLNNLGLLYADQGKYEQAEPLYQRAITIREQQLGVEHPDTAQSLNNLANLYTQQGKYEQAEPLYQRTLAICEQHLGAEHPLIAYPLHGLAELYQLQEKYEQAEPFYQRALTIRQQRLGPTHPETQDIRKDYVAFLRMQGRDAEATALDVDHELPAKEGH